MSRVDLEIGNRVRWAGGFAHVEGWVGGAVRLRPESGGPPELLALQVVVGDSDFEVVDDFGRPHALSAQHYHALDGVPESLVQEAVKLRGHIWHAVHGCPQGTAGLALMRPDPDFDPALVPSKKERLRRMAARLGMGYETLRRKERRWRRRGLAGLIDHRKLPHKKRLAQYDPKVIDVVRKVVREQWARSNTANNVLRDRVNLALKQESPGPAGVELSTQAFNRLLLDLGLTRALQRSPRVRAARATGPAPPFGSHTALRPGQVIMVDENKLDVFALDRLTMTWVRVSLLLALDLCTRSIVGWRFAPVDSNRLDAALLLHDVVMPKPMRPDWPDAARFHYFGIPDEIVLDLAKDVDAPDGLAGIPFPAPRSVVTDHGWIFKSDAFLDACELLHIDLVPAREYTWEDKAEIERTFKSINSSLWKRLTGYKGPDVFNRGVNAEREAFYFIHELEALFARWVVTWWQKRPHKGLRMPDGPRWRLSPNIAYNEAIARCGFVHLPPSRNLYYELLPKHRRTIQEDGVEMFGLHYDSPELPRVLRGLPNPDEPDGRYTVRYDDRNLLVSHMWLRGQGWITLRWRHAPPTFRPFTSSQLAAAKQLFIERHGRRPDEKELGPVLVEIVEHDIVLTRGTNGQRLAARRAAIRLAQHHAERGAEPEPERDDEPKTSKRKVREPVSADWGEVVG